MTIPDDKLAKLQQHINTKWTSLKCPHCNFQQWTAFTVKPLEIVNFPHPFPTGQTLPTVGLVCTNCGNTVLINARVAGLIDG